MGFFANGLKLFSHFFQVIFDISGMLRSGAKPIIFFAIPPRTGVLKTIRYPQGMAEANFIPDYGRIMAYRGATGFGIRLDGGTAYSGAVITRY